MRRNMAVKQGNLLSMMQQSARNGTLLSSCEPEVRELMHQIDVLISGKQAEWAVQWAGLETQLREKERELAAVRHTLWQKDTELEQLRQQTMVCSAPKKRSYDATPQNDRHVQQLTAELERMTEKYEQLKARRHKHTSTQSVSVRKCSEEIHQLRQEKQVLEDVRARLERDKSALEGQLKLVQFEITALQEKCSGLESEVKFCRSQLDQKDSLVAAIEQSSTVRAKQLEAQLKRTQELADLRDLALQRLRNECEERKKETETAFAEKVTLNSQLTKIQAVAQQLKGKYSELQLHVKKVEDQLMVAGSQLTQREQSMKLLQESSQRKDDLIRSLGGRQGQRSEVTRLKQELSHAHSQLQTDIQHETDLREEMNKFQQGNATGRQEIARLTAECASKDKRLAEELARLTHKHATELKELQSRLSVMTWEKTLALEQKDTECEARVAGSEMQVKLLEDRLRTAGKTTDSVQGTASGTRKTATHKSLSSARQTERGPSLTEPTTIQAGGPPQPAASKTAYDLAPSTQPPSTSRIIDKFLKETDKISHTTPSHEYATLHENATIGPKVTSTHSSLLAEGFVPLRPVSQLNIDENISARSHLHVGDTTGQVDKGSGRSDREERGAGDGGRGHGRRDGGGSHLEDMFSKTLDGIVDRHFQQLDSSLRKLMSKET